MRRTNRLIGFSVATAYFRGSCYPFWRQMPLTLPFTSRRRVGLQGDALEPVHAEPNVIFLFSRCWRPITVVSLRVNSLLFTGTFQHRLRFRWSLP